MKYDFRDGKSNGREVELSRKFDWLPRSVPVPGNGRLILQERGGAALNTIVSTSPKDQVARELASFLAYARHLAKLADQGRVRIKDFLINNVAKGRSLERPWLCVDVANWSDLGPRNYNTYGIEDIQVGLRKSWEFGPLPGLAEACASWLGGPGSSEGECASALMPYLTGESTASSFFSRLPSGRAESGAGSGLLDRDCLAGVGVAARVAAWQEKSAGLQHVAIHQVLEEAHPWVVPKGARGSGTVVPGEALPFDAIVVGDSTWRRLPELEYGARRFGAACTPGGSLTRAHGGRPPALLTLQRLLAREHPQRRVSIFCYPMQGSTCGDTNQYRKSLNKASYRSTDDMIALVMARLEERKGVLAN